MGILDIRERLKSAPGLETLTIEYEPTGHQRLTIGDKVLEIGPMASNAEIVLALKNTPGRTEKLRIVMSAIDRIKAKALQARDIAPQAIREFEADLDGIIAEKANLAQRRADAVGPHKETITGIYGEFDGLKQAMDLLSNGGPPLQESEHGSKG